MSDPPEPPAEPPPPRRRPTPFASFEAASRERLLGETAEAWYHFGDALDLRELLERIDESLAQGGERVAAALVFAVLSSDDTNLSQHLRRATERE